MKIDRLLSIIVYLLNHELVSARILADRFGVTIRTIQRDLESIELAGIPVIAVQGPNGGYGIMENFKIDRQLVSLEDLYYIITSLQSVSETLTDEKMDGTLEKVKNLLPAGEADFLSEKNGKLSIDFSMLGGDPRHQDSFRLIKEAVDSERLLQFNYTNNKLESSLRTVEPLTIAFKWRAWYLFGWCCDKEDYRLFRISRTRNPKILPTRIKRKKISFETYLETQNQNNNIRMLDLVLKFHPSMSALVEEYYPPESSHKDSEGFLIVQTSMPDDGWMYGFLLSYGDFVTVLEPSSVREGLRIMAEQIKNKY